MSTNAIRLPTAGRSFTANLVATAVLAGYSVAAAAGFARVFPGWDWFDNLVAIVLVGHGAGLLLRRLTVPGWIAVPLTLVLLAWAIGVIHYRATYSWMLPTGETLDLLRSDLELVRGQFRTAVAPVHYGLGWDVLASIGVAIAVLLGDTFAFRAAARTESLVPAGVLFVFVSAVGYDRLRIALTITLVAAGALAVIVLRAFHATPLPRRDRRARSRRLVAPMSVATAVVIALLAGMIGPRLPGASATPLYETRGRGGGNVTTVVSPLVDIRSRLTNRSQAELFVMRADEESYWRSSALPEFDGQTWGLPERTIQPVDGQLSATSGRSVEIRQRLRISDLSGRLVPAAADPVGITGTSELRWSAETSTVLVTDDELTTGDEFEILSAAPRYSRAELENATSADPPGPIYTELPDNFPESVHEMTLEVTAGAATPYEAALTLQQWFRDPDEFTYSLDAQSGHGSNHIEAFLRGRVGYCEQFAGTYAAMLRTIGIPTRVAVGFTPGIETSSGTYSVRGKNAHAWPEVWFDGLGWVPFEPTPGRGAAAAENYTDVAANQDDSAVQPGAAAEEGTPASSVPPPPNDLRPDELIPFPGEADQALPAPQPVADEGGRSRWWLVALAVLAVGAAAPALVRRIRRHTPGPPERELARLWDRAVAAGSSVGVDSDPAATPGEAAAAAARRLPAAARPFQSLAEVVTDTAYRPDGPERLQVIESFGRTRLRQCSTWTRQIEKTTKDALGTGERARRYFTTWS